MVGIEGGRFRIWLPIWRHQFERGQGRHCTHRKGNFSPGPQEQQNMLGTRQPRAAVQISLLQCHRRRGSLRQTFNDIANIMKAQA